MPNPTCLDAWGMPIDGIVEYQAHDRGLMARIVHNDPQIGHGTDWVFAASLVVTR